MSAVPSTKAAPLERLRTGAPGPVAWVAILLGTPGFILLLYGVAALILGSVIEDLNDDFSNDFGSDFGSDFGDDTADDAGGAVAGMGLVMLAIGGFYLAVAIGLIMLVNWTRVAAIVLGSLHALVSLITLVNVAEVGILMLGIAAAQIGLLFTPTAQQAFKTRSITLREVEQPLTH